MKKKELKNFNEQQNKLKLKIPQPNKYYSIKKSSGYNPIVSIKLNNRQSKQNMINKKSKKSMFKDSLDENISESKTNILIPDSLNNTKNSIIIETIRNTSNNNNLSNNSDRIKENKNKKNENDDKNKKEEVTKKIDYRYYTNYPIKEIFNKNKVNCINNNNEEETKLYWLATYDKLMKKQKIIKILNYYYKKNKYKENDIKEKLMQIKDFDIFFPNNSNIPLIQYSKNNLIFVKLYLLTLENINIILSYINRIKININCNDIEKMIIKGNYQIISDNHNFKYNIIYFMGTFLNINIYGFSNIYNDRIYNNFKFNNIDIKNNSLSVDNVNQKEPSSKNIAKLIKILMNNFPKFDADFFICYLLSKIKFNSYIEKSNEIKNYIYSNNTIDLHHRIINSNYLAEVAGFRASFTATSIKTPNSSGKNNISNYKQKFNYVNNDIYIQNQKGYNTDIIKYPNFTKHNQIFNKFKHNKNIFGENLNKNIIKVMSSKEEKVRESNSLYNMNMNYIKIGTIKNKIIHNSRMNFNNKESSSNNIIKIQNKSNINKKKEKFKKIFKLKSNRINMNKSQQEKNSLSENNNYNLFDSNKIDISKIINNKKKKPIKKSSIYYDKNIAKMFYYKTEVQKKSFDRYNNKLNKNNKVWGTYELLNSFDLNKYLMKNNNDKKDKNKDKKSKRNIGIYVVDRRIKTDIEDEENSLILLKPGINNDTNNNNNSSEEFMTPQRKKKYKYYY